MTKEKDKPILNEVELDQQDCQGSSFGIRKIKLKGTEPTKELLEMADAWLKEA